jgi:hypothetical protein
MAKEQVIVFEGEHMFVAPKNHVVNRKTGMVHHVASEMNVVAPIDEVRLDQPIEPPKQPDDPIQNPSLTPITTNTKPSLGNPTIGGGGGSPLPSLGDPTKLATPQEEVTPAPTPEPEPKKVAVPLLPISFGSAPIGGGGGGGGSKKEETAPKKTLLQKYWWILVLAGVGGYIYYKRKK